MPNIFNSKGMKVRATASYFLGASALR